MVDDSVVLVSQLRATLGKMDVALGAIVDAIVWTDGNGRIQWSNRTFDRLVHRQRFEVLGKSLLELLPLVRQSQVLPAEAHPVAVALKGQFNQTEVYEFHQINRRLVLEISSATIQLKGQESSTVLVIRDITVARGLEKQRQQAEEALAKSEAKFRSLIQNSSDLLVILEPAGTIQYASPSHKKILGYRPRDLLGRNAIELVHPEDVGCVLNAFHKVSQKPDEMPCIELRLQHKDGSWCFLESTANNLLADPSVGAIVINSRDITVRKRVEEQLRYIAFHDELTGLPNRALFMELLGQAVALAKQRQDYSFAVLFLDLDRFKVVNDSLGHIIGDQLLIAIARRLKRSMRPNDTVARLG